LQGNGGLGCLFAGRPVGLGAWCIVPVKRKGVSGSFLIVAKCMSKRPFWLLAGRSQSIFSHFWDVFGLFPTLLFLILRQMIFRFQPNDFSFGCERFAYMREIFVCSVYFWIFIHKKLSK